MLIRAAMFLGLAYFGLSSIFGRPSPEPAVAPTAVVEQSSGSWIKDASWRAAASATGIESQPLNAGEPGCSQSALTPDQLGALLDALPTAQRAVLAQVLNSSATVWASQLYAGPRGMGLCIPAKSKLIVIPGLGVGDGAPT